MRAARLSSDSKDEAGSAMPPPSYDEETVGGSNHSVGVSVTGDGEGELDEDVGDEGEGEVVQVREEGKGGIGNGGRGGVLICCLP